MRHTSNALYIGLVTTKGENKVYEKHERYEKARK